MHAQDLKLTKSGASNSHTSARPSTDQFRKPAAKQSLLSGVIVRSKASAAAAKSLSVAAAFMASTSNFAWDAVATFSDVPSAQALASLFRAESVPAEVVSDTSLLGEARRCEIRVPLELAHRARWLMLQALESYTTRSRPRHPRN